MTIHLLSGGAAQGLVGRFQTAFAEDTGHDVQGRFGAVGLQKDALLAGATCDVLILTRALIAQLEADGHVVAGSACDLGAVATGVAVKTGAPHPTVDTAETLKAALMAARGIYFPDPVKATAGIHFMKVMQALGVDSGNANALRPYPNGNAAMGAMAQCDEPGLIGCTQVTEILFTPGVDLVGLLPPQFALNTVYTAAVCTRAQQPQAAAELVRRLAAPEAAELRAACGFA